MRIEQGSNRAVGWLVFSEGGWRDAAAAADDDDDGRSCGVISRPDSTRRWQSAFIHRTVPERFGLVRGSFVGCFLFMSIWTYQQVEEAVAADWSLGEDLQVFRDGTRGQVPIIEESQ